jgi:hypothetical protein
MASAFRAIVRRRDMSGNHFIGGGPGSHHHFRTLIFLSFLALIGKLGQSLPVNVLAFTLSIADRASRLRSAVCV